ncbi:hypothetical protein LDJ79_12540 [Vibrio tritonius]|uniref:Uncharacterized protein n=1 Tax=Vibrio tritonius TaxID=1435069 RepID=A0ABS7YMP8_9VIBR|nr:hypothetical protein [Vibrio tritonius]MCA2016945.1 hypothetical protein [Vibrio tritonius]
MPFTVSNNEQTMNSLYNNDTHSSHSGNNAGTSSDELLEQLGQRASEMQQQNMQALQVTDRAIAQSVIQQSLAQSEKAFVDTANTIANGYVDSANKANNANTQSGKGINF